jgi:predicted O-methyltransferase YrrM
MVQNRLRRPAVSPRFFNEDWFSGHIPLWETLFADRKGCPRLAGLEIGSYEGRSASWLLEHVVTGAGARLDCVDVFNVPMKPLPGAPAAHLDRFRANVAPWRDHVRIHVGKSSAVLRRLPPGYDFVYIDGAHRPAQVLTDAVLSWLLLKTGGLMIFDDYEWAQRPSPAERAKLGIDSFLACFAGHYEVLHRAYQVALRKTDDSLVSPDHRLAGII